MRIKHKKVYCIVSILMMLILLAFIFTFLSIYGKAEIVGCIYNNSAMADYYYDISVYRDGKISYTKYPTENNMEREKLLWDFGSSRTYYEKETKYLSCQDRCKLFWTLLKLRFVDRKDRSNVSGMVDRAQYTIYGETFCTVPESVYFPSDKFAKEITDILKEYCNIKRNLV